MPGRPPDDLLGPCRTVAILLYLCAKITSRAVLADAGTAQMSLLECAVFGWDCFPIGPEALPPRRYNHIRALFLVCYVELRARIG